MTQCQAAVQGFGPQETKRSSAERERRSARWRVRAGQWGLLRLLVAHDEARPRAALLL